MSRALIKQIYPQKANENFYSMIYTLIWRSQRLILGRITEKAMVNMSSSFRKNFMVFTQRITSILNHELFPSHPREGGDDMGETTFYPNTAAAPNCSSILNNWLYFATRSDRDGAPVLICPQLVATAKSAMVVSSVSPERCDMIAV